MCVCVCVYYVNIYNYIHTLIHIHTFVYVYTYTKNSRIQALGQTQSVYLKGEGGFIQENLTIINNAVE